MHTELRRLRKAAGITQDELAAKLGVNRATISKYETGQIAPTIPQLQAIADALGVHLLDLLGMSQAADGYNITLESSTKKQTISDIRALYDPLPPELKKEFLQKVLYSTKKDASTSSKDDVEAKVDPKSLWEALVQSGYVAPGKDLTDADLRFLLAVGDIIHAWFASRE